jgi:hypothetical protein
MSKRKFSEPIGELNVGDVIAGEIYPAHLKVISKSNDKELNCKTYLCKYLDGVCKGETTRIYDFFDNYKLVR